MAQPNPERLSLDQILRFVDQLPPDEQSKLCRKLIGRSWGQRWRQLIKDVEEDNKELPPISDEDIISEMRAIKQQIRAERATGSH